MASKREDLITIYIASSNGGKIREFHEAGIRYGFDVQPLPDFSDLPPCNEDGRTFEQNAVKKALHYSGYTQGLVFADDSGLAVDALEGAPGVHSARYAGPNATDAENNRKLLSELSLWKSRPRTAHYICVIVLAQAGEMLGLFEGRADGIIIEQPRGTGGFGYDPYFFYPPLQKTFAELSSEEKFKVSHRGEAFRKMGRKLREICRGGR